MFCMCICIIQSFTFEMEKRSTRWENQPPLIWKSNGRIKLSQDLSGDDREKRITKSECNDWYKFVSTHTANVSEYALKYMKLNIATSSLKKWCMHKEYLYQHFGLAIQKLSHVKKKPNWKCKLYQIRRNHRHSVLLTCDSFLLVRFFLSLKHCIHQSNAQMK